MFTFLSEFSKSSRRVALGRGHAGDGSPRSGTSGDHSGLFKRSPVVGVLVHDELDDGERKNEVVYSSTKSAETPNFAILSIGFQIL